MIRPSAQRGGPFCSPGGGCVFQPGVISWGRKQPQAFGKAAVLVKKRVSLPFVLGILLLVSLVVNGVLAGALLYRPRAADMAGAYVRSAVPVPRRQIMTEQDRFLMLYDDGAYLLYEAGKVLDSGSWSLQDREHGILLFAPDGAERALCYAAFAQPGVLHFPDEDAGVAAYARYARQAIAYFLPEEVFPGG